MKNENFEYLNDIPVMGYVIGTNKNMLYVNDFWLAQTGYAREEVVNRGTSELLTKKSIEMSDTMFFPELLAKGSLTNVPFEIVTKDGKTIQVIGSATLKEIEGETFVIGAAYNISTLLTQGEDPYFRDWLAKPQDITRKLVKLRNHKELTQEVMSEILGVSVRTYQRIEQGTNHLSLAQILTLSQYFSISPHYFMTNFNLKI